MIIDLETLQLAHTEKIKVTGSTFSSYQNRPFTSYGYGWFIEENPDFTKRVYHTGDNGGFQIYAGRYPKSECLLLIFSNRNDYDRWQNVTKVDSILVDAGWIELDN